MPDPFEQFGDSPPSEAEPQDGGLTARLEHATCEDASCYEQRDSLLAKWLLAMTPEQRLRSHDGALEWFLAVRSGRIKLYGAMDISAPPMDIAFDENTNMGI